MLLKSTVARTSANRELPRLRTSGFSASKLCFANWDVAVGRIAECILSMPERSPSRRLFALLANSTAGRIDRSKASTEYWEGA